MTAPPAETRWPVACRQWRGARPYQEDDFGTLEGGLAGDGGPPAVLMVLADGMGGEAGGAVASRAVVETFLNRFPGADGPACDRFRTCLDDATDALHGRVSADPGLDGMGSTVVAAHYDGRELSWLSVGDSPMWLFSGGRLARLNADHSMAPVLDRLARDGGMSPEEARDDGRRNMLRSAVTVSAAELVDCARRSCRLRPRDCLLIASDGLQTLSDEDIERRLAAADGDAEAAADALFSAVRDAAGPRQDNVTFMLLSGGAADGERAGRRAPPALFRRGAAAAWRGLALGLAIGLLAAAVALWWPEDGPPAGEEAPSPPPPEAAR